ncbi:MAG: recombination protein RecR [Deltaproteobacteria bacterium]|nr:recombination protein RecR [Deltaproteobacteria bacterium]
MKYQGPPSFLAAVEALSLLPGVGEKTAQRLIFSLMKNPHDKIPTISQALVNLMQNVRHCEICFGYSQDPVCPICLDTGRDQTVVCVVEDPTNVFAIEKSGQYHGLYHVLGGVLAPLDGVGPDQIRIKELLGRFDQRSITEVILATSPNVEGDATAMYISQSLEGRGLQVSRIAQGIPTGGSLEYTDQYTLGRAITDRRQWL